MTIAEQLAELADPNVGNYKKQTLLRDLAASGDAAAGEVLVSFLTDDDRYLRREAAKGLSTLAAPSARAGLRDCLADSDYILREYAVRALGLCGTREDLAVLQQLEDDVFSSVRNVAREAIVQINARLPGTDSGGEPTVSVVTPERPVPDNTAQPPDAVTVVSSPVATPEPSIAIAARTPTADDPPFPAGAAPAAMPVASAWSAVLGEAQHAIHTLECQLSEARAALPRLHAAREDALRALHFERADKEDDLAEADGEKSAAGEALATCTAALTVTRTERSELVAKREKWWNRAASAMLLRSKDELERIDALATQEKSLEQIQVEADARVASAESAWRNLRDPILELEKRFAEADQAQHDNLTTVSKLNHQLQATVIAALSEPAHRVEREQAFAARARDPHLAKLALEDLRLAEVELARIDAELKTVEARIMALRNAAGQALDALGGAIAGGFALIERPQEVGASLSGSVRFSGGASGSATGRGSGTASYTVREPQWQATDQLQHAAVGNSDAWFAVGAAVAERRRLLLMRTGCTRSIAEFVEYLLAEVRSGNA